MDNAAVPLRYSYQDDTHPDAQVDQEEVLSFPRYDYSKIWACMGRVGANGVMRAGFVEEGDPVGTAAAPGPWLAGTIETVAGGAPVGVQYWNTNVAYNPFGGLALNDFGLYGCLAPCDEFLWHLAAGLGAAPPVAYEYWTGAAWAALTTLLTPDWTCATTLNQRLRLQRPSNWAAATPAQLGLVGLANPGTYFFFRVRLTAPIGAAPAANTAYRDHFKGHWRFFYSQYAVKRGDDSANVTFANFIDDGNFTVRFRDGFGLEGRIIGGEEGRVMHGSVDLVNTRRPTIGKAWSIIQTGRSLTVFGGRFAGGLLATIPRHKDQASTMNFLIRSGGVDCELYGCMLNGWMQSALGGTGGTAIKRIDGLRITPHPLFLGSASAFNIINVYGQASDGNARRIVLDVPANNNITSAIRSSVPDARIEGIELTHDEFNTSQFFTTLRATLFDIDWGGPATKMAGVTQEEYRRLTFLVREDVTGFALNRIPIRIFGSDGVRQNPSDAAFPDDATDNFGKYNLWQSTPFGFSNSEANKGIFLVEKQVGGVTTVLDDALLIQVNPTDHAYYNPLYQPLTFVTRFPRKLLPDANLNFSEQDWQRFDLEVVVALPRVTVPPDPTPDPYVPQYPPATPYIGTDPGIVPYVPDPAADVDYVPDVPPDPNYSPCDPLPADVYGLCDVPPVTVYARLSVPEVDYIECGTTRPGKVLLLVPGMVMRLSGS